MVWRDLGVSRIITEEISPVKESMMALGPDTVTGCLVREKSRRIVAMAVAGTRNLLDTNRSLSLIHQGNLFL